MRLLSIIYGLTAVSAALALPRPIPGSPTTTTPSTTGNAESHASPLHSAIENARLGHNEAAREAEEAGEELKTYIGLWDPKHNLTPEELFKKAVEAGVDGEKMTIFQNSAFSGFAGPMNNHCIRAMSSFDGLEHFEPAVEIFANDIQVNAPWGLQRLSQGDGLDSPPRDPSLLANNDFRYTFNGRVGNLGKDVDIYIIDTGINVDHVDFDGRARWGFTVDTETDEQGHGTHVAGTAAGSVWGVAKSANIIAVKVLGTRGTSEDILRGLDYVIKEHEKRSKESNFAGSIGSMSLGSSSRSPIIDRAVAAANNLGIHFSVAAGNESQDACRSSPAASSSFSSVISVGAINVNDARASFSNFGQCAQVYAPGEGITSTWIGGTKKVNTIDGTSMACPHVTGLMAYMLSQDPSLKTDPAALKDKVLKSAIEIQTDVGRVKVANNGFN